MIIKYTWELSFTKDYYEEEIIINDNATREEIDRAIKNDILDKYIGYWIEE